MGSNARRSYEQEQLPRLLPLRELGLDLAQRRGEELDDKVLAVMRSRDQRLTDRKAPATGSPTLIRTRSRSFANRMG